MKEKPQQIVYKGKTFYKNKGYYVHTLRLHRQIWEDNFGEIPKDYHIHHKNGDFSDNSIDNLECIHKKDHHKIHFDTEKQVAHLHKNRWKANLYHKSEKGRKRCSEISKENWLNRKPIERNCVICEKKFLTKNLTGTKYCSQKCRSKAGYEKNFIKVICVICKNEFKTQKIKNRIAKTCSPECSALLASQTRRNNKRVIIPTVK